MLRVPRHGEGKVDGWASSLKILKRLYIYSLQLPSSKMPPKKKRWLNQTFFEVLES